MLLSERAVSERECCSALHYMERRGLMRLGWGREVLIDVPRLLVPGRLATVHVVPAAYALCGELGFSRT